MAIHLDTNLVIAWSRGKDDDLNARLSSIDLKSLSLSFVVEAELRVGMAKSRYPDQHRSLLTFIEAVRIVQSSPDTILAYVRTRTALEQAGMRIGENDLWIAATALAEDATLVTRKLKEFSRVPGLRTEDWQPRA